MQIHKPWIVFMVGICICVFWFTAMSLGYAFLIIGAVLYLLEFGIALSFWERGGGGFFPPVDRSPLRKKIAFCFVFTYMISEIQQLNNKTSLEARYEGMMVSLLFCLHVWWGTEIEWAWDGSGIV